MVRTLIKKILLFTIAPIFTVIATVIALIQRWQYDSARKPRLFFGNIPIISNNYWSRAMQSAGYDSETFMTGFYEAINKRDDWDRLAKEEFSKWPRQLHPFLGFFRVLYKYDVLFISCQGAFIGTSSLWRLQSPLFKLAKKKVVVFPYGSDSYVYRNVHSVGLLHGLIASYPQAAKNQSKIAAQVEYWCKHADVFIPGVMSADGFGRWDVLMPSQLFIDASQWRPQKAPSNANGFNGKVIVCHAPNHRGFKGTEFVVDAIHRLQAEGLQIELHLIEKVQNSEVRRILTEEADILVEQLIFTGHGFNGLEGLSSGIPVVCNLEDEDLMVPLRRWSYFGECPIVSATPENLDDVLRKLITRPELRHELGLAGRAYVEKYHALDSAVYFLTEIIEYLYGRRESLINMYHPLLGQYPKRSPKIVPPLINNRIVD